MKPSLMTMMMCMAIFSMAQAQTADSANQSERPQAGDELSTGSVESERGRLGMQRAQTEAEIRAREEQQRLEEAKLRARQEQWRLEQAERERAQAEAMHSQATSAPSAEPRAAATGKSKDMSRTLGQLKSLGELKDDGYITEEEFQKIKQKILDSQL